MAKDSPGKTFLTTAFALVVRAYRIRFHARRWKKAKFSISAYRRRHTPKVWERRWGTSFAEFRRPWMAGEKRTWMCS